MTAREDAIAELRIGEDGEAQVHALLYVGDQLAALRETRDRPLVIATPDLDAAFPMPPQWKVRDWARAAKLAAPIAPEPPEPRPESTTRRGSYWADLDAQARVEDAEIALVEASKNLEAARQDLAETCGLAAIRIADIQAGLDRDEQAAARSDTEQAELAREETAQRFGHWVTGVGYCKCDTTTRQESQAAAQKDGRL